MEIIYLAIILFIAGVGATIVYDKVKAQRAAQASAPRRTTRKPRLDPVEQEIEAFKSHMDKKRAAASQLDKLLSEVTVNVQRGNKQQVMSVSELIQKLEDMKKKL